MNPFCIHAVSFLSPEVTVIDDRQAVSLPVEAERDISACTMIRPSIIEMTDVDQVI